MSFLTQLVSASPLTYGVVFLIVAIDALLPFVQAEAVVITAAVLAAKGDLHIWLLVPASPRRGFAGDNASYFVGRTVGCRVTERFLQDGRRRRRLEQAEKGIGNRGGLLIMITRFIPVGRTLTTLAAGTLEMAWRRFAAWDAAAATLWAVYACMLGYAGGASFEHGLWKPLVFALGTAFVLGLAAEGYRRWQRHRGCELLSGELL